MCICMQVITWLIGMAYGCYMYYLAAKVRLC